MAKAQHMTTYILLPQQLRLLRDNAGLTQRELGTTLRKPQSWVYNCETANRRVDVTEFILCCRACDADPMEAFGQINDQLKRSR